MARRRSNPYTSPRPADWSSMTKLQRSAWNRSHWSKDGVTAPLSFEKRAAARRAREATASLRSERKSSRGHALSARDAEHIIEELGGIGELGDNRREAREEAKLARQYGFSAVDALRDAAFAALGMARHNPRVAFRTCKGKKVSFKARRRRKGKQPKHLRKYAFKRGHKPANRCGKRRRRH